MKNNPFMYFVVFVVVLLGALGVYNFAQRQTQQDTAEQSIDDYYTPPAIDDSVNTPPNENGQTDVVEQGPRFSTPDEFASNFYKSGQDSDVFVNSAIQNGNDVVYWGEPFTVTAALTEPKSGQCMLQLGQSKVLQDINGDSVSASLISKFEGEIGVRKSVFFQVRCLGTGWYSNLQGSFVGIR